MVYQNKKKESTMARLIKAIVSTLVMFSLVTATPTETVVKTSECEYAVQQESSSDAVFASADVKKKKKKGKKIGGSKGKKSKKGFFSKIFGSK